MRINKELEQEVIETHKQLFPNATLESQLAKLQEEIEEVENASNMQEFYREISDCYIVAFGLKEFSQYAYELALFRIKALEDTVDWEIPDESFENMIKDKMDINKSRTWEQTSDGYYKHKED